MKALLLGLFLTGAIGCTSITPVGPLAHKMPVPANKSKDSDVPEPPAMVSAPKPVPPAMLIVPDEVTVDSAAASTQKLTNEFDYDRKSMPAPSKTAEISRIKAVR
jgi:hypothetical protein